ncbi:hypothetical protein YC2023_025500 [Brassica napus]
MLLEEALTLARAFSHFLNMIGVAKTHHRLANYTRHPVSRDCNLPHLMRSCNDVFTKPRQGGISPYELHYLVCKQVMIHCPTHFYSFIIASSSQMPLILAIFSVDDEERSEQHLINAADKEVVYLKINQWDLLEKIPKKPTSDYFLLKNHKQREWLTKWKLTSLAPVKKCPMTPPNILNHVSKKFGTALTVCNVKEYQARFIKTEPPFALSQQKPLHHLSLAKWSILIHRVLAHMVFDFKHRSDNGIWM